MTCRESDWHSGVVVVSGEVGSGLGALVTERVKELAKEQGFRSGRELAGSVLDEATGKPWSHQRLFNLYHGKKEYDFGDLRALASALGTTVERLLDIRPPTLPPPVQRLVDQFTAELMHYWQDVRAGQAERRALIASVREAWRRSVRVVMDYWEMEVSRPVRQEPSPDTRPSRPRRAT